jgi:hypothetical protein
MTHIFRYDGHYFRLEIAEVVNPDQPGSPVYVGWCSDGFRDLKDMPSHGLSTFVVGPQHSSSADALHYSQDWIKSHWDAQKTKRGARGGPRPVVIYTVSLFKVDSSLKCEFDEFSDAKAFAKAAEKSADLIKVGITNNESPQYLTLWEKS